MGTAFVKIWTNIKRHPAYVQMNNSERGAWFQLLIECKDGDDNSHICCKNVTTLSVLFNIDTRTLTSYLQRWRKNAMIRVDLSAPFLDIEIIEYEQWQQVSVKDVRRLVTKLQKPKPENPAYQSRAKQTKPKHLLSENSDHKKVMEYFCDKHLKSLNIKYKVQGGRDGKIVKGLLSSNTIMEIERNIDTLFNSPKKFYNNNRTLGILSACWNQLSQEGGNRGEITENDREYEPAGRIIENRSNTKNA